MDQFDPTGKTVVVSGASGFVGSAVVEALALAGARAVALCRDIEKGKRKLSPLGDSVAIHQWDMANPLEYPGAVDAIVHAAGHGNPAAYAAQPADVMRDNYLGCMHILDFAVAKGASRFVLVSSGEAYGVLHFDRRITEADQGVVDPLNPRSCYPLAKMAAENLCLAYARQYGLSASIARLCHIFGPGMDPSDSRIACQFPLAGAEGRDIVMKSAGEQRRSLCYIDDAARALLAILAGGGAGEMYNIANEDAEPTIREFAEKTATIGGVRVIFNTPTACEKHSFNPMPNAVFSAAKVRKIGWEPRTGFEAGLRETVAWFARIRKGAASS